MKSFCIHGETGCHVYDWDGTSWILLCFRIAWMYHHRPVTTPNISVPDSVSQDFLEGIDATDPEGTLWMLAFLPSGRVITGHYRDDTKAGLEKFKGIFLLKWEEWHSGWTTYEQVKDNILSLLSVSELINQQRKKPSLRHCRHLLWA